MMKELKGRDFLTLKDYTPEEIKYLLKLSVEVKEKKRRKKAKEWITSMEKMLPYSLKKTVQEQDVLSK